jgi:hypothetical protein
MFIVPRLPAATPPRLGLGRQRLVMRMSIGRRLRGIGSILLQSYFGVRAPRRQNANLPRLPLDEGHDLRRQRRERLG